ncbi:MAG: nucleoside triphosphate pyrophosphatase [Promethearchaeota archaeon]
MQIKNIILASGSRDRKNLLENLKINFKVIISDFEEYVDENLEPEQLAVILAEGKLNSVLKKIQVLKELEEWKYFFNNDYIIIAADTIVEYNSEIIGKAKNKDDAFKILKKLSGNSHYLITGFVVFDSESQKIIKDFAKTEVVFNKLSDEDIWNYINNSTEYQNRAGAYSLRERASLFIKEIKGSPSNVIGLPLEKIYSILKKFNLDILQLKEDLQNN